MSFYRDMLNLGANDVPVDKTKVESKVSLDLVGKKWELNEAPAESIISTVGITRSSQASPRPFIDNIEYTFGITIAKDKGGNLVVSTNDKVDANHSAYVKMIADSGLAETDKGVKSFLEFISNDPYKKLTEGKTESGVAAINTILFNGLSAIRVCVGSTVLAEKYADRFKPTAFLDVRCSISGKMGTIVDPEKEPNFKTETLRRVPGACPNLITLSCNTQKYPVTNNYNFSDLEGSPVSDETYTIITRNIQKLVDDKRTCVRVPYSNGVSYLFNYDKATDDEPAVISAVLNTPVKEEGLRELGFNDEDPANEVNEDAASKIAVDRCNDIVYQKYLSLRTKRRDFQNRAKVKGKVTVYRFHAVKGRASCTDTFICDLGRLSDNIGHWYDDTLTSGRPHSIATLLRSTVTDKGSYNSRDYENIMQSILLGRPINRSVFKRVLFRAALTSRKADATLTTKQCQIALIRACYNSIARYHNRKELTDMLDTSNKTYAYNLGRLLALGDYVQYKVHDKKVAAPVSGRLDKRAMTRPTECVAELLSRVKTYQDQMGNNPEKGWVVTMSEKLAAEITENLAVSHPEPLTIDEQAQMRVAFYQQKNAFYTKNTNKTDKE